MSTDLALRNPIGTHVLVGPELSRGALVTAEGLGCGALQIFAGNPRGWTLSAGDPAEDRRFRDAVGERGLRATTTPSAPSRAARSLRAAGRQVAR